MPLTPRFEESSKAAVVSSNSNHNVISVNKSRVHHDIHISSDLGKLLCVECSPASPFSPSSPTARCLLPLSIDAIPFHPARRLSIFEMSVDAVPFQPSRCLSSEPCVVPMRRLSPETVPPIFPRRQSHETVPTSRCQPSEPCVVPPRRQSPETVPHTSRIQSNETFDTQHTHQHPYPRDELDDLIESAAAKFMGATSWSEFIKPLRMNDVASDVSSLNHPAAHLLHHFGTVGVPALMHNENWEQGRIDAALARGPHKSAKDAIPFLREEFVGMIHKGHWILLPADLIRKDPRLRLSPIGVVPQRGRRPRMISDYTYFGVNGETIAMAPPEAMQFGRTLQRLLYNIHRANPAFGPVHMSKIDISDGFYRIWVNPTDAPRLAVLFPSRPGEPKLIAVPMTLPMGWKESPPAFSANTETVTDLANNDLKTIGAAAFRDRPHRLDVLSESKVVEPIPAIAPTPITSITPVPKPFTTDRKKRPVQYWDVYVDDFCGLSQGNKWKRRAVKRALLHALDKVFRPLEASDGPHRQEPASLKKLLKGDATWDTRKVILGWLIDTVRGTIELPPHRIERLHEILDGISPNQKVIAVKEWHKVLGELRSMSIAIPGARGLFSVLQEAFRHVEKDRPRLRLTKQVHDFLADFKWLANDISSRPTRIAELIPDTPATLGAVDAAGEGMGGVHFVPTEGRIVPILWRRKFPTIIQQQLVSWSNPTGTLTNSDFELTGNIAHMDVLAQFADVRERTIHNSSDNVASVYWLRKGSTTTTGAAAYLLRLQSLHQRQHRYVPRHDYIPGWANEMADICSRAWHLSNDQLLSHFDKKFPQNEPWQLCSLRDPMYSALTSALFKKRSDPALLKNTPTKKMPIGDCGILSVCKKTSIPSSKPLMILSQFSKSSASDIVTAGSLPAAGPSDLAQYLTPFVPSARCTPGWGPKTRDWTAREKSTTV